MIVRIDLGVRPNGIRLSDSSSKYILDRNCNGESLAINLTLN
jgi:hypothetical protein